MPENNQRPQTNDGRRKFLVHGATALTAMAVVGAAGCQIQPQQKASKAEAGYQPRPNGPQACGNCANFIAPDGCRVVQGPVGAGGWSRYWRPRA